MHIKAMAIPTVVSSRELPLPGRKRPLKISMGLRVRLKPRADGGLMVEIKSARKFQPLLQQIDIGDALWGFGMNTGVHAAVGDEAGRLAGGYQINVELCAFSVSVSMARLTALELAQVGSLVREMAREMVRNAIVQQTRATH